MERHALVLKEIADPRKNVFSHVLEVEGSRLLVNCGTPYDMSLDSYRDLDFAKVDAILISHMGINYLGALPHAVKSGFRGRIYATLPIKNLGKFMLIERCRHFEAFKQRRVYDEDELEHSFESILGVKYLQPIDISENLSLMAHNSGHTLGGTVWRITKNGEDVVFGLKIDHRRTNHLNGVDMGSFQQSVLCIFDTGYARQAVATRKGRNTRIREVVDERLRMEGRILIVVGYEEFLELGLILDEILKDHNAKHAKSLRAVGVGFQARRFSELVKSMVEWSGDNVTKDFMEAKENPFSFRYIDFSQNYLDISPQCQVFIAFEEFGYSTKVLELISGGEENLVLNFSGEGIGHGMRIEGVPSFVKRENVSLGAPRAEKNVENIGADVTRPQLWYEMGTDVWASGESGPLFFPLDNKNAPFDAYNEFFEYEESGDPEGSCKSSESGTRPPEDAGYFEEISITETSFVVRCQVKNIKIDSISDMRSSINVLEFMSPQKLLLIPTEQNLGEFYFYMLKLNRNLGDVVLMKEKESHLLSDKRTVLARLDGAFHDLQFRTAGERKYLGFRGAVEDGTMRYLGRIGEFVTVGNLNLLHLRKCFIERNIEANVCGDTLLAEERMRITVRNGLVFLEGEYGDLYYIAKEVLYENMVHLR